MRQSRRKFRKQRKIELRRVRRQQEATERGHVCSNEDKPETPETLEQQAEYLQQKKQWEEREKKHNALCITRKMINDANERTKEASHQENLLATMPLLAIPSSVATDTSQQTSAGKRKSHLKSFVSTTPSHKRYKDRPTKASLTDTTSDDDNAALQARTAISSEGYAKTPTRSLQDSLDTTNWP